MGGRKKCFLQYEGRAFYERVYEALSPYCEKIYLSVENKNLYKMIGLPMVQDHYSGIGPMGGLQAGLSEVASKGEALFAVACDMPFFTASAAGELIKVYQNHKVVTLAAEHGKVHPLCGIYPGSVLPALEEMIKQKNYRMMDFLSRISWQSVSFDGSHSYFRNINTTEEYRGL